MEKQGGLPTDREKGILEAAMKELFNISNTKPFDESSAEQLLRILSNGQDPDDYLNNARKYDQSPVCGLVWNANFFAYRCRDCGISPCMSLCADCFLQGDHEGHDFNIFKSQAGGACDCGDDTVMKTEGFCQKHRKHQNRKVPCLPQDVMATPQLVLPIVVQCLYETIDDKVKTGNGKDLMSDVLVSVTNLLKVLNKIVDIDFLRDIVCDKILSPIQESSAIVDRGDTDVGRLVSCKVDNGHKIVRTVSMEASKMSEATLTEIASHSREGPRKYLAESSPVIQLKDGRFKKRSYLEYLMDVLVKAEFPNKLSTVLLQLLPNQNYKETFTRLFCRQYTAIGNSLVTSLTPDALSNHMVHVSVQLFSNEMLAFKMVREENLLSKMIFVLTKMIQECTNDFVMQLEDGLSFSVMVDCDNKVLRSHCFWPFASDFTNVLSHQSVAKLFLESDDILCKWIHVVKLLTVMNINNRRFLTHVEYESRGYYTAFSIEFESVAAVMWELYRAILKLNNEKHVLKVIELVSTFIQMDDSRKFKEIKLRKSSFTIHLSLLRYFALFVSQAVIHFNKSLEEVVKPDIVKICVPFLINAVGSLQEIRAGFWVYNGQQIRCQAQSYLQSYFCNSMLDLDLFYLQVAAAMMDPDEFIEILLDRFCILPWFEFGEAVYKKKTIDNEFGLLIEGFLNTILMLLTHRVYAGASEDQMLRKDIIAALCVADRTHSQLMDCIPSRPGDSNSSVRDGNSFSLKFEKILGQVAEYKSPVVENSNLQQGQYSPTGETWLKEYDYNHIQLRFYKKSDHQQAQERYNEYVQKHNLATSTSTWPPMRKMASINAAFAGIFRLLQSKLLHKILTFIVCKISEGEVAGSESLLISTISLIQYAMDYQPQDKIDVAFTFKDSPESTLIELTIQYLDLFRDNGNVDQIFPQICAIIKTFPNVNIRSYATFDVMNEIQKIFHKSFFSYILGDAEKLDEAEKIPCSSFPLHYLQSLLKLLPYKIFELLKRLVQYWYYVLSCKEKELSNFPFLSEHRCMKDILLSFFRNFDFLFQVNIPSAKLPYNFRGIPYMSTNIIENAVVSFDTTNAMPKKMGVDVFTRLKQYRKSNTRFQPKCSEGIVECHMGQRRTDIESAFVVCKNEAKEDVTVKGSFPSSADLLKRKTKGRIGEDVDVNPRKCLLGLLINLQTSLTVGSTTIFKKAWSRSVAGDGAYVLNNLLIEIYKHSGESKDMIATLIPDIMNEFSNKPVATNISKSPQELAKQERRRRAKERQQKLLADFASQQKRFLENVEKTSSMEVCQEEARDDVKRKGVLNTYECVICTQTCKSTEDRPIGLVVLMVPSTVLAHRRKEVSMACGVKKFILCGKEIESRKKTMLKLFQSRSVRSSFECGVDYGINIQSCGHYIHIDCQQSYFKSLQEESQRLFNTDRGEFSCPLCRQLSNGVLPLLPENFFNGIKMSQPFDSMFQEVSQFLIHQQGVLTRFSSRALQFTVLTESFAALSASMEELTAMCNKRVVKFYKGEQWLWTDKFFILVACLRNSFEGFAQHHDTSSVTMHRTVLAHMMEGFHFHCQHIFSPMCRRWSQLVDGHDKPKSSSPAKEKSQILHDEIPILLCDPISLLIQFIITWPQRITKAELHWTIQLLYNLTYIQALCNIARTLQEEEKKSWSQANQSVILELTLNVVAGIVWNTVASVEERISNTNSSIEITQRVVTPHSIDNQIQEYCLPFLKTAHVIFHVWTNETPDEVTTIPLNKQSEELFQCLTSELQLGPSNNDVHEDITSTSCLLWPHRNATKVIKCWCEELVSNSNNCKYLESVLPISTQWELPALVRLPESFDRLFQTYRKVKCKGCDKVPDDPTICLVCCEFLCFRGACCVKESIYECVQHSIDCGCGTGIFLVISSSNTLVIRDDRVCSWGSVYLDVFGEEDRDLKRGKPLFLSEERYRRLQEEWRTHTLDRSTKRWGLHLNRL